MEAEQDPVSAIVVNAVGTGNILQAAVDTGVEHVCLSTTVGVYGYWRDYGDHLVTAGWRVLTVWECQLSGEDALQDELRRFLAPESDG